MAGFGGNVMLEMSKKPRVWEKAPDIGEIMSHLPGCCEIKRNMEKVFF
ncbi:MAG: hypothetical protein CM15mP58_12400 [Burkholderiaceae bacterium]|nr:MAG: hypothetical protein CM15mP58_12400 [Burkholderiaceae bacterium]